VRLLSLLSCVLHVLIRYVGKHGSPNISRICVGFEIQRLLHPPSDIIALLIVLVAFYPYRSSLIVFSLSKHYLIFRMVRKISGHTTLFRRVWHIFRTSSRYPNNSVAYPSCLVSSSKGKRELVLGRSA